MAILPIVWAPDPILKARCARVETVDDEVRRLMDDMLETMYDAPGVGLAAPQVGVKRRIIVVDCSNDDEEPNPLRMVNPELIAVSEDEEDVDAIRVPSRARPLQVAVVGRPNVGKSSYINRLLRSDRVIVSMSP